VPASRAAAQGDVARAEDLFREGKRLLGQKRYDDACPKFAESARLEASSGVELALGICYEGQGKTASAWGAFTRAQSLARRDGRHDRETSARQRAHALEPRLSRVTFTVPPATSALPGLEVLQDGVLVGNASWSESLVDPGPHTVEVKAPFHVTYNQSFNVSDYGARVTVTVPPLAATPAPVPVAVVAASPPRTSVWKPAGIVVGATAVAAVVVASVVGVVAIDDASDVHRACPSASCGDASAVSENQTAGHLADASTALFITGGVLAASGAVMFWLLPGRTGEGAPPPVSLALRPVIGPGSVGFAGTF
jgi:hypothetical protein